MSLQQTARARTRTASHAATSRRMLLRERLEGRREEIEAAALTRVKAISDLADVPDPAYAAGLRASIEAATDYGLEALGRDLGEPLPVPNLLLAQARLAARAAIPLDTVLRRYFAGFSLFSHFVLEELGRAALPDPSGPQRLLDAHTTHFDRLLAAIGGEYARETQLHLRSSRDEQAECVERLLQGGMVGSTRLGYELAGWHVGVVAVGAAAERKIREAARCLDCRLLCIPRPEGTVWGWVGARRRLDAGDLMRHLASDLAGGDLTASVGEPAEGVVGWRLTHRQATAALGMTKRTAQRTIRYRDVALLASVDRDELLSVSLRRLYLEPLEHGRDRGALLRLTLRAYFGAQGNSTSAAAALGVSRQTVHNRLRAVEEILDRTLDSCGSDLAVALNLAELDEARVSELPASRIA